MRFISRTPRFIKNLEATTASKIRGERNENKNEESGHCRDISRDSISRRLRRRRCGIKAEHFAESPHRSFAEQRCPNRTTDDCECIRFHGRGNSFGGPSSPLGLQQRWRVGHSVFHCEDSRSYVHRRRTIHCPRRSKR